MARRKKTVEKAGEIREQFVHDPLRDFEGSPAELFVARTALWLRRQYPKAMVISRASKKSLFASQVGQEHNIVSISITQLVEDNLPGAWVRL